MTEIAQYYRDIFASPESIDANQHIIVSYRVEAAEGIPLEKVAIQCALDGSTVAWAPLPHHTSTHLTKYTAKVRSFSQTSDRTAVIDIAFPLVNILPDIGGIPLLFAMMAGSIFRERSIETIRIVDIELPPAFVAKFPGPRYGIAGLRERLGVKDRPILVARIHDVGIAPKELAAICREVAYGGADIIYSSPLLADTEYSPMLDRVEAVVKALNQVRSRTRREVLYFPNLTVNAPKLREMAKDALEAGAAGFETDMTCTGFSVVQMVREDLDALIIFYPITHSIYTRGTKNGIDLTVFLKLGRLVGADMTCISAVVGRFELTPTTEILKYRSVLVGSWYSLKASLPIVIGGQHPGTVKRTIGILGPDIGISAGTGIMGHPKGCRAGAKAMQQAIEIVLNNISNTFYRKYQEYNEAIEKWCLE